MKLGEFLGERMGRVVMQGFLFWLLRSFCWLQGRRRVLWLFWGSFGC